MVRHAGRGPEGGRGGREGGRDGGRNGGPGRRKRGVSKGRTGRPYDPNAAPELCLIAPSQLLTKNARGTVIAIARTRLRGAWVLWPQVKQEHRDLMYRDFRSHFYFDIGVPEEAGYKAWEGYHQTNWTKWLSRMRSESNELAGLPSSHEITLAHKAHKPEYVEQEYWEPMVDYWSTDDVFKKRCQNMRAARAKQQVKHTAGSKPFTSCYADLEKDLGRTPSMMEKFKLTHCKGGGVGEWATERCEEIATQFNQAIESLNNSQDNTEENSEQVNDPISPETEMETWINKSGGRQKNRVLGLGPRTKASTVCPRYPGHGSSSAASGSGGGPSFDEVTIAKIVDEVDKRMMARQPDGIPREQIRAVVFEIIYGSTAPEGDLGDTPVIIQIRTTAREVASQHFANMISTMHQAHLGSQGNHGGSGFASGGASGSGSESGNGTP